MQTGITYQQIEGNIEGVARTYRNMNTTLTFLTCKCKALDATPQ